MKYKIGDKVRIKSIDWYNQNEINGIVVINGDAFNKEMSNYCGQIMTISNIELKYYLLKGTQYAWTDDMIEGKIDEALQIQENTNLELSNHQVQDILDDMGMIDENGNCPYTAEEIFKAGVEYAKKMMIEKLRKQFQDNVYDRYFEMHEDYIEDFCKELMEE